jgi:protocatechuate 3,4-dioxygenase beta subunit/5-hydroxyisourate hydrolase-like protein (transthyretin family)
MELGSIMQKLIPLLLLLALAGAGFALWKAYGGPDDVDPLVEEPEVETVEERRVPKVQAKSDEDIPIASPISIPKSTDNGRPGVEQGPEDKLQGRVLDAVTKKPLSGVKVELLKFEHRKVPATTTGRLRIQFDERPITSVRTDDQGRYVFSEGLKGMLASFVMRARTPNYVSLIKDNVGAGNVVDFQMEPAATIRGVVVNAKTGAPIGEATVEGNLKRDTSDMHRYTRWRGIVKTNAQGEFEFNDAPSGAFNLLIEHPEFEQTLFGMDQSLRVERGGVFKSVPFRIKPALTLKGKVVDAVTGKPVAKTKVELKELPFIATARAFSGNFGRFLMKGVKRGAPELVLTAEGYTSAVFRRELSEESTASEMVFQLQPAGSATGIIYDPDGNPVPNAEIYVGEDARLMFKIRNYAEAKTDREGRYSVGQLDAGKRYRVIARSPGYILGASADFEAVSGETVEGNIIQLEKGSRIQGRVVDNSGIAVAGAVVSLEKPPHPAAWFPQALGFGQMETISLVTDENGLYEFTGLYTGAYSINADHDDFIVTTPHRFRVTSASEEINHDFDLARGHTISGNIVDEFGNKAAGVTVEATPQRGSNQIARALTDEEGNYELRRLRERPYRIRAYSESAVAAAIDDVPTDSSEVNFTLQTYGRLVGTLMGRDGSPVRSFKVEIEPLADVPRKGERYDASRMNLKMIQTHEAYRKVPVTSADGSFAIDKMMPGDYRLTFTSESYREVVRPSVSVQPGSDLDLGTVLANNGGRLEGTIKTADGKPVPPGSVEVTLRAARGTRIETSMQDGKATRTTGRGAWPGKQTTVGEDGLFSVGGLPPGRIEISLRSKNYCVPKTMEITVGDGTIKNQNFEVELAGSIHLQITDEEGEPVPNPALVDFTDRLTNDRVTMDGKRISGRSRSAGQFHILKTPPGKFRVIMRRADYDILEFDVDVEPGERVSKKLTMRRMIR